MKRHLSPHVFFATRSALAVLSLGLFLTGMIGPSLRAQAARVVDTAAQQPGSITGSLIEKDKHTAAANVTVTIRETGAAVTTDKKGRYTFTNVPPGTYTLVATGEGYGRTRITDVVVHPGSELSISHQYIASRSPNQEPLELEDFVVSAKQEGVLELDPYEVTDSRPKPFSDRNVDLPRTQNDVQPYYIFDSQKIEESGTNSVEDFLKQRLTMNTTIQTSSQVTRYSATAGQSGGGPNSFSGPSTGTTALSSVSLNGLGADHTLILVNGLPMAGVAVFNSGGIAQPGQPDVNGIPLAAIDRIEVLPSSAGAIYGAGAEGGVINIILKKAYSGGDITATYGSTWDGHGPTRTLEATFGKSFEHGKTQLFVTAQYSDQSPMFVGDRANLLNRGYANLLQNDPSYLGVRPTNATTNAYFPLVGSTPNFASQNTTYPVPINTPGVTSFFQTRPIGFVTGSGLPTTAADPWVLSQVQPLTLKSNGAALGGANPYIATLPVGYSAASSPSSIIGGQWNLSPGEDDEAPNGLLVPLGNYPRRKSLMATLTRQMTDKLQLHVDYSYNENHSSSNYNPVSTQNGQVVPASAPINPFNQAVEVSFPFNYSAPAISNAITNSITLGGTLKLPLDWIAQLDYQWSENSFKSYYAGGLIGNPFSNKPNYASNTFLGVPDTNPTPFFTGAINPFVDTLAYPINWAPFSSPFYNTGKSTSNDLVFAASGPLFHLPWGDPRLSIRLEHNKSGQPGGSIQSSVPNTATYLGLPNNALSTYTSFAQTQSTDKANAELDLPVFKTKYPFLRSLDVQLNFGNQTSTARLGTPGIQTYAPYAYSPYPNGATFLLGPNSISTGMQPLASYTDQSGNLIPASNAQPIRIKSVNSNTSLTGPALSYRPFDDIILRASVASGYVAPTYAQLVPNVSNLSAPSDTLIADPKTGTSYSVPVYSLGGNPNLNPTTSKSWDFGAIWEPKWPLLRGLRVDAEYVQTNQQNLILSPDAQTLVSFESNFPGLVVRDATSGLITSVTTQNINVAEARQSAWTYTLDYIRSTPIGTFELTGAETIQEHVQQQLVIGTNFLEFVGFPNSGGVAKTKATGTLRWSFRNWVAAWTVVKFGGYNQFGAPGDPGDYATQLEQGQPYTLDTQYTLAQGGNTIPSQTYHNLYLSYNFHKDPFDRGSRWGRWTDAFLSGMKVSLVVNNVFNTVPPFDAFYRPFYTSPYGDVQLRNFSITLKKSF